MKHTDLFLFCSVFPGVFDMHIFLCCFKLNTLTGRGVSIATFPSVGSVLETPGLQWGYNPVNPYQVADTLNASDPPWSTGSCKAPLASLCPTEPTGFWPVAGIINYPALD